jgi:hypothetical protein
MEYKFTVKRNDDFFGDGWDAGVSIVRMRAIIEDLYDFNFEDGPRPRQAATVQIGAASGGGRGALPDDGHLFRVQYKIDHLYRWPFVQ